MSEGVEEKTYIAESLDFINSYKDKFSPLLASIAKTLNNSEESKALLATMEKMTNTENSNLKELIVKLKELENIGDNTKPIYHNGDYSKYVEQCLRLIQLQHSKRQRHDLFISVMRDMKANTGLMNQLKTLKASLDWKDWKKMVGMLIPEGANVKILTNVIEPSTWLEISNKFTAVSGKDITGTVVKRAKLNGRVYGGEFKKLVKLQEDLIRNKGDKNVEFSPEHIQLIETEPSIPAVTEAQGAEQVAETEKAPVSPGASTPVASTPVASTPVATVATGTGASGASGASGATGTGATGATEEAGEVAAVVAGSSVLPGATEEAGASGTPVATVATVASGATGSPAEAEGAVDTQQVNLEEVIPVAQPYSNARFEEANSEKGRARRIMQQLIQYAPEVENTHSRSQGIDTQKRILQEHIDTLIDKGKTITKISRVEITFERANNTLTYREDLADNSTFSCSVVEFNKILPEGVTPLPLHIPGHHGDDARNFGHDPRSEVNIREVKGGSQRITRKNKKSIGTVRKTRTNH